MILTEYSRWHKHFFWRKSKIKLPLIPIFVGGMVSVGKKSKPIYVFHFPDLKDCISRKSAKFCSLKRKEGRTTYLQTRGLSLPPQMSDNFQLCLHSLGIRFGYALRHFVAGTIYVLKRHCKRNSMSTKVNVSRSSGKWLVTKGSTTSGSFSSKSDAVETARKLAPANRVVVRNSAGQVLRQANVKTSFGKAVLRSAIAEVDKYLAYPDSKKRCRIRAI